MERKRRKQYKEIFAIVYNTDAFQLEQKKN